MRQSKNTKHKVGKHTVVGTRRVVDAGPFGVGAEFGERGLEVLAPRGYQFRPRNRAERRAMATHRLSHGGCAMKRPEITQVSVSYCAAESEHLLRISLDVEVTEGWAPILAEHLQGRLPALASVLSWEAFGDASPAPIFGRVALMGRRELGVCRITEHRLAGATVLRIEEVTRDPVRAHQVNPEALYSIEEMSVVEAHAAMEEARARREKEAREAEEKRAATMAARAAAEVRLHQQGDRVYVVSQTEYARADRGWIFTDSDVLDAMESEGLRRAGHAYLPMSSECIGLYVTFASEGDAASAASLESPLARALRAAGFEKVAVGEPWPPAEERLSW